MNNSAATRRQRVGRRLSLSLGLGGAQAAVALLAGRAAAQGWRAGEGDPAPAVWLLAALALCCGTLAFANLTAPLLDGLAPRPAPRRLAVMLPRAEGNRVSFSYGVLLAGLAFLAPTVPLGALAAREAARPDSDWALFVVGAILAALILGGALLALGAAQLYTLLVGGPSEVEAEGAALAPGEAMQILVRHRPGRVRAAELTVRLVCTQTREERRQGAGRRLQTKALVERELCPPEALPRDGPWERPLRVAIPGDGLPSANSRHLLVSWSVRVRARYARLPATEESFTIEVRPRR